MIRRDLVILAIAVVCGILAFVLIANILSKAKPRMRLVIAAETLAPGEEVTESSVTLSEAMEQKDYKEYFLQPEDVIGSEVLEDIQQGQLIRRAAVRRSIAADSTTPVSQSTPLPVPANKKALDISADEIQTLPERLLIGSYVDVLGNFPIDEGASEYQTVARGAQVLFIEKDKDGEASSVTLALSPVGVDQVTKALAKGKVRLVGSNASDVEAADAGFIEIIRGVEKQRVRRDGKTAEEGER